MSTKYKVVCDDPEVYAMEAYGQDDIPTFDTHEEAEAAMAKFIAAWPEDAPVRDEYHVIEVEA